MSSRVLQVHREMTQFSRRAVVAIFRAYKWGVSPMFLPACRYRPTCSEYALEAVERYGVLRGGLAAAWRLLRCNPFVKGGFDPVVGSQEFGLEPHKDPCWPDALQDRNGRRHIHSRTFGTATNQTPDGPGTVSTE